MNGTHGSLGQCLQLGPNVDAFQGHSFVDVFVVGGPGNFGCNWLQLLLELKAT